MRTSRSTTTLVHAVVGRANMRSILVAMMKSFSCSPLIFLVCRELPVWGLCMKERGLARALRPVESIEPISAPPADIRMMAFSFRKFTNFLDKGKRLPEIAKPEAPLDAERFLRDVSAGDG
jgi:hypothetical protein